jgi:hypothetical protein
MDLMKYIEAMHRFRQTEGYYPAFGKTRHQRDQRDLQRQGAQEAEQPPRVLVLPRRRRRYWK